MFPRHLERRIAIPGAPLLLAAQDAAPVEAEADEAGSEQSPAANERGEPPPTPVEEELIDGRRRPDIERDRPDAVEQVNPGAIRSPPPEAFPADHIPIPDRWRLIQTLGIVRERWWDPYNQNTLKGDRPLCTPDRARSRRSAARASGRAARRASSASQGDDWFFVASAVSDTVFEPRSFPIPVGVQTTQRPGSNDVFGRNNSIVGGADLHLRAPR